MSGQIQFKVDTSAIDGYLPAKSDAIIVALMERTTAVNRALQAKIAGDKLQGGLLKSHTNKLAGSVRTIPTQNDGQIISGGVQAGGGPAYYAKFLEDGTRPHIITAVNAKALMFMIGGKAVFAKSVHHPGNKAFLFMKGTLAENQQNIVSSLQNAAKEAAL